MLNSAKDIIKIVRIYLDKVEEFGYSGQNPQNYGKIKENIGFFSDTYSMVSALLDTAKLGTSDIFKLFSILQTGASKMTEFITIFNESKTTYGKIGSTIRGSTITKEYIDDINKTLDELETLIAQHERIVENAGLTEKLGDIIVGQIKGVDDLKKIKDYYTAYINTIDLYVQILRRAYSRRDLASFIRDQIEELKTISLGKNTYPKNPMNFVQNFVQNFRLVPDCESMPIKDLSEKYFQSTIVDIQKLGKLFKDKGFIILYKICGILEHKFDSIVNGVYGDTEGVNLKYIRNTVSIKKFNIVQNEKAQPEQVLILPNISMNNYYCIESLDNKNYRMLRMWESTKDIYIPAGRLKMFLTQSQVPSSKLSNYNNIICTELARHIGQPILEREKERREYWSIIRERIFLQMKDYFDQALRVATEKTKIEEILVSTETINKILSIVLHNIVEKLSMSFEKIRSEYLVDILEEIAITCISDIKNMRLKLKSEINDNYKMFEPEFKKNVSKGLEFVGAELVIIQKMMDSVLKTFIDMNTGIFVNIESKLQILSECMSH
jgi:hypothetical protein